ncbi:MAG: hypothetical protein HY547_03355, partial [Elusimicrobia bacterium]|nr:hypothetical protein [Elusimicrobiota bacterium]
MNLGNGYEVPVIQKNLGDSVPRAVVFVDASKQLTPAQAKRARFIFNLRDQYQKAKDSLAFIELFAASFGLSEERIETIKKINGDTL